MEGLIDLLGLLALGFWAALILGGAMMIVQWFWKKLRQLLTAAQ